MWPWINRRFRSKLTASRAESAPTTGQRAEKLVALGDKMLALEDFSGALQAYESALYIDRLSAPTWHRRGHTFIRQGEILRAIACYLQSLQIHPESASTWCDLGEAIVTLLREKKDQHPFCENFAEMVSEAQDCFARALRLGSSSPSAQRGLDQCRSMIAQSEFRLVEPRWFSFHPGGILEDVRNEVITPFLKPRSHHLKNLNSQPE